MSLPAELLRGWTWRMAWRDSRSSRRRLLLYSLSISLGIAALVAVGSLSHTLRATIDEQAKSLLGADLLVTSRKPFGEAEQALFATLGGRRATETSFASMLSFPSVRGTRLVNVRALEGGFPFYGTLDTDPPSGDDAFRRGEGLLVEESVARQFNVQVGDPVKLGDWTTRIAGLLRKVPGDSVAFATLAPRVYLSAAALPRTGLLKRGSLVRYRAMFAFAPEADLAALVREHRGEMRRLKLDFDTVDKRRQDLGKSLDYLNAFLNLVAFIALLLGAVGIASAVHVHLRQRLPQVAVLRCLGAPLARTFAVYLAQAGALGAAGSLAGIALGAAIQFTLPVALASLLPFPLAIRFSWPAALQAGASGLGISLVFALLPLLAVRRVSPLAAIRAAFEPSHPARDPARWAVVGLIGLAVFGFAMLQTRRWWEGAGFAAGLGLAFALLGLLARGVMLATRRLTPAWLPFPWRQGLANLHRPQNRTGTLLLALGLGTFLLLTLQITRSTLLQRLFPPGSAQQPNMVLFDVQPDQRDGLVDLLQEAGFPATDEAPIITMRLARLKDRSVAELATNRASGIPGWTLQREYRSTWRTNLAGSEQLVAGRFTPSWNPADGPAPVSVEKGLAGDLGLRVGDSLTFDVQGVPVECRVGSLREVEWRQVRPNFFIVFPAGVLEAAPSMHVLATRVPTPADSARLQRQVVEAYPNVSVIDLTLVLQTLDGILSKVGFAIRFMALFTVATGLVVLTGAIVTGRWQRVQESILLRTLGASRAQIRRILLAEYASLGLLAALTGGALSIAAGAALARWMFRTTLHLPWTELAAALVLVPALTVAIGLLTSRGISNQPPLEILRRET